MAGKQIDFPPGQKHSRGFETWLLVLSLVCIVFVVLVLFVAG